MYCPDCGAEVHDGATFCQECGANVENIGNAGSEEQEGSQPQSTARADRTPDERSSMQQTASQTSQSGQISNELDRVPIVGGVIGGVGAWLVNFLVVFGLLTYEFEETVPGGGEFNTVEFSGLWLYNAHNVKIDTPYDPAAFSYLEQLYAEAGGFFTVPKMVYYLLPAIILVIGGYLLVKRTRDPSPMSTRHGIQSGAALTIGYLAVSFIGAVTVFSVSGIGAGSGTLSPQLTTTILLMGIAYPVLFGGLGGLLATRTN